MSPLLRYINRDQDTQRRAFVEAGAAAQGYTTERVPAINGYADDFGTVYAGRIGGDIGPGTQACFLSHAATWARIAEGDAPYGLVCEDDATFLRPAVELAPYLSAFDRYDILFFNDRAIAYRDYAGVDPALPLVSLDATWTAAMDLPKNPSHPRFGRTIRDVKAPGGDFYGLTRAAAARLVAEAAKDRAATDVDCWLFYKCLAVDHIHAHRRRFIPRYMRGGGASPLIPPLNGAIADRPFATTDSRRAGGRVRNPNRAEASSGT